jgi:hypothetical protein
VRWGVTVLCEGPCLRQMEMKNKFINHARNIWDRAVTLMPRCDVFWFELQPVLLVRAAWRVF